MTKSITQILDGVSFEIYGDEVSVENVVDDSRKITPNTLFIVIVGFSVDSHKFIPEAIKKGAIAIIGQRKPKKSWIKNATYIKVKNTREVSGQVFSNWYDKPSKKMRIVGITGTKGKSTTAYILYKIFQDAGIKVGAITSMGFYIGGKVVDIGFHVTNPGPSDLQKMLSDMVKNHCEYAILEVTSHGLDQNRIGGVEFNDAVITNITHEHIDYHKTFQNYRNAKLKIFKKSVNAYVNKDDSSYGYILKFLKTNKLNVIDFSTRETATYKADNIQINSLMSFDVVSRGKIYKVVTPLIGEYNASNILGAISVARANDVSWKSILYSLRRIDPPPGKLEKIENDKAIDIYIDFAHTPDSLEKVLYLLKQISKGKVISIFGCASERDVLKRPMMGDISTRIADVSIFTAEDPRNEDVNKIIDEISSGVNKRNATELIFGNEIVPKGKHVYFRIPERGEAIHYAINKLAKRGDTVAIFGKGHEKSMAYHGVEHPWDDKEAVLMALKNKIKIIKRNV